MATSLKYLLFTTTTCPKCPAVKSYVLDHVSVPGAFKSNVDPDFGALAQKFEITHAPTLIVLDRDEHVVFKGSEIYEIEEFFQKMLDK